MHNINNLDKMAGVNNRVSKTSTLVNSFNINNANDPSEAEETCIDLLKDSVDKLETDTANNLLKDTDQNRDSLRKTDEIVKLRGTHESQKRDTKKYGEDKRDSKKSEDQRDTEEYKIEQRDTQKEGFRAILAHHMRDTAK